ncbi:hypothetical protein NL676_013604 [Syzygium grande]|nr:hypothetical protein NL676_013604 [Syzygium grande]
MTESWILLGAASLSSHDLSLASPPPLAFHLRSRKTHEKLKPGSSGFLSRPRHISIGSSVQMSPNTRKARQMWPVNVGLLAGCFL